MFDFIHSYVFRPHPLNPHLHFHPHICPSPLTSTSTSTSTSTPTPSSPSQLVESFCTDYDDILRVIDRPERMQNIMVGRGEPSGTYVTIFLSLLLFSNYSTYPPIIPYFLLCLSLYFRACSYSNFNTLYLSLFHLRSILYPYSFF
jgi:hypothetical protein